MRADSRKVAIGMAASVAALVGFGLALMAVGGLFDRGLEPEVVVDDIGGWIVGGAEVDSTVVVAVLDRTAASARTILVRLDPQTGRELDRVILGEVAAADGLGSVDDDLVLRVRAPLPDVPRTEQWWPETVTREGELWLVVIDGETLAPVHQYLIPPFDGPRERHRLHEPLVITGDTVWLLGIGMGAGPIDLRTRRYLTHYTDQRNSVKGVVRTSEGLAVVWADGVRVYDPATGETVRTWYESDLVDTSDPLARTKFIVRGTDVLLQHIRLDKPFQYRHQRLDLVTGEVTDGEIADDDHTAWWFESGGYRWELIGRPLVGNNRTPDELPPGARWRQVDVSTGEVVYRFGLDRWRPRFATSDHLWVSVEPEYRAGRPLARIPLPSVDSP